jgi:hypothetical protein
MWQANPENHESQVPKSLREWANPSVNRWAFLLLLSAARPHCGGHSSPNRRWVMRAFQVRGMRRWLLAGGVVLAACNSATAPGHDPQIINATNNFQYQITDIQNFSGTQVYRWQNTGTTATVNQSAAVAAGSATLVLLDANGVQVYSHSLTDNGTFSSSAGTAGSWTVRVTYSAANATVNFRLDKAN